jgi:hypothetical protein
MGKPKRIRDLQGCSGSRIVASGQNVDDHRGRAGAVIERFLAASQTARPSAGAHPRMVTICRSPLRAKPSAVGKSECIIKALSAARQRCRFSEAWIDAGATMWGRRSGGAFVAGDPEDALARSEPQ